VTETHPKLLCNDQKEHGMVRLKRGVELKKGRGKKGTGIGSAGWTKTGKSPNEPGPRSGKAGAKERGPPPRRSNTEVGFRRKKLNRSKAGMVLPVLGSDENTKSDEIGRNIL